MKNTGPTIFFVRPCIFVAVYFWKSLHNIFTTRSNSKKVLKTVSEWNQMEPWMMLFANWPGPVQKNKISKWDIFAKCQHMTEREEAHQTKCHKRVRLNIEHERALLSLSEWIARKGFYQVCPLKWTKTSFVHPKFGSRMIKWVQSEIMNMNSDEEKIRRLLIGVISRIILYLYFETWTFHVFINFHVHDCSRISLSTVCSIQNHKSV